MTTITLVTAATRNMASQLPVADFITLATGTRKTEVPFAV
jgi:hypothetical protein